ncbi:hypothetical protein, partial [Streptomyces sp. AcH 505]|uniref:hypothetical protein n=1 Tax=Streptomyces sp. AcH 505 TaxID=352211 RepID=UPI001F52056C
MRNAGAVRALERAGAVRPSRHTPSPTGASMLRRSRLVLTAAASLSALAALAPAASASAVSAASAA